jgi:hypothetical protein
MPESGTAAPRRGLSPDISAVILALLLALLVRFNLIPPIKW